MVWLASVGGVVISEGRSPAYTGQGATDRVLQLTATHLYRGDMQPDCRGTVCIK